MLRNANCHVIRRCNLCSLAFVPKYEPVLGSDIKLLELFIKRFKKILVVTGAGISTESGIPDYRSEGVGLYARTNHKPIQYQTYLTSTFARQRYWARNYVGWPRFSKCLPNFTHHSVRILEEQNKLSVTVTQNVDNLHSKAGSKNVIELHGSAFRIVCLGCNVTIDRNTFQQMLERLNPNMNETTTMIRPDGDVEIPEDKIHSFRVPSCSNCGNIYKPDIVFFGDNVPAERVNRVKEYVSESEAVLALGTSFTVFSSYRIALQAKELGLPIAIINIGRTRADDLATLKISTKCGDILPRVCQRIVS